MRIKKHLPNNQFGRITSQLGFTLMELMLVIGIIVTMSIVEYQNKILEMEQANARTLGMELFQYNVGVQKYLAHKSGVPNPASLAGSKTGVDWLKHTSCGGTADSHYLSCNFLKNNTGKTTFGKLTFSTSIAYDVNNGLSGRTVMSKLDLGKGTRGDLSGLAALVASGAYVMRDQPTPPVSQDGRVFYCPDLPAYSTGMLSICGTDKDHIVMFARNHSPSDKWLRVDHGNVMQNVLEFRTGDITPATISQIDSIDTIKRQIRNVARIYNLGSNNGNGETENLYLGKMYGNAAKGRPTLGSNSVIVDAHQEVLGQLRVQRTIRSQNDVNVMDGNLYVRDAAGGQANAGNITAQRSIAAGIDITAGRNVTASNDVTATNGNLVASNGFVLSQQLIDSNDNNYYVDPSSTSRLNLTDTNAVRSLDGGMLRVEGSDIRFSQKGNANPTSLTGSVNVNNLNVLTRSGNYVGLQNLLPNYVDRGTYSVPNLAYVAKPSCFGGTPKIIVTPQNVEVKSVLPTQAAYFSRGGYARILAYATDSGASWRVHVRSAWNDTNTGRAVVRTFCYY